jgi:hypothetical protein
MSGLRVYRDLTIKMWTCATPNEVTRFVFGRTEKEHLTEISPHHIEANFNCLTHFDWPAFRVFGRIGIVAIMVIDPLCFDTTTPSAPKSLGLPRGELKFAAARIQNRFGNTEKRSNYSYGMFIGAGAMTREAATAGISANVQG